MRWRVAPLVVLVLLGACSSAPAVGDVAIDDIGTGWKRSIDVEVTEDFAGLALALVGSDQDPNEVPPAWLTVWERGREAVILVILDTGRTLRDDVSTGELEQALRGSGLGVVGQFSGIDRALRVLLPEETEPGVVIFVEDYLVIFDFAETTLSESEQLAIMQRQLAVIPEFDPASEYRTQYVIAGLLIAAVLAVFAIRSARKPFAMPEPDGEDHDGVG